MQRQFKPKNDPNPQLESALPLDRPVAVYYRQSTRPQVGNISTDIQTIDMKVEMVRRGWNEADVLLIDADAAVSGSLKIDEREGMRQIFEMITEGKIGAVACQDEDRLFRDVTQIQVNIFIEACREHQVQVITPSITYVFHHPAMGDFYRKQFRYKCEVAAEYINTVIIGKMFRARMRHHQEGHWAGWNMAISYMVDGRSELERGVRNPDYHIYVPFEPYAEVIRAYYRIFVETGGSVRGALQRIHRERLSYPDPAVCLPPHPYKVSYSLKWRGDGYYPGRTGLVSILTNPAYIGHWCVEGVIVRWNNHPAIVPPDLFWQAFNYLSEYNLDGTKNANYRPTCQNSHPSLDENRPVSRPLCAGLIFQNVNEKRVQVGTHYYKRLQRYVYDLTLHHFDKTQVIWKRSADWVDDAITHHFLEKLKETFNAEAWNETVQESHEILKRELRRKRAERQSLEADMQSVILIMETVSNASIIRKEEARYEEMERELERLTADIAALEKGYSQFAAFSAMRTSLFNVPMGWAKLSRDERHNFIAIFTDSIEVTEHKADDALRLVIHWRDNSTDVIAIGRKPTTGRAWTAVDRNKLRELAQVKASQIEIAAAFPDLKWGQIRNAITRHVGRYTYPVTYVHKDETYKQFLARGGTTARPIRSFRDTSLEVCYQ